MAQISDSRRAAMNLEEAALLPAMPRSRAAGSAAFMEMIRCTGRMAEKQLSTLVDQPIDQEAAAPQTEVRPYLSLNSRAALHQVLRR